MNKELKLISEAYVGMLSESANPIPKVSSEKYSWGKMKHISVGQSFSIPMHPEHHEAVEALEDGKEHNFKDETKTKWNVKRDGDNLHFTSSPNVNKTTVSLAKLKSV